MKYIYYDDIGILTIYPGTHIYDIAKQSGQLDDSYWLTDKPTPLFTVEHSEEKLKQYKDTMLNHISLKRIITLRGIRAQFHMIPYIIRFFWSSRYQIPMVCSHLVQRFLPNFYYNMQSLRFLK